MIAVAGPRADAARPEALVEARVQASGSSFYWAMRLLPPPRRTAMYAIYAFCREVDDIADERGPSADKLTALARWRREVDALYAGRPEHPIAIALVGPVAAYHLRREDFLAIIDGVEMDAREDIRAPSLDQLDLYCARVAGAVGRLSVRAFGVETARADDLSASLGRALQLTNILRDLAEDAERGRLYLPSELLSAHGVPIGDPPAAVLAHPALPAVARALAAVAYGHFAAAAAAMADCPRRAMRPAAVMEAVYRALLDRLVRSGWTDVHRRVRVPDAVKLWLIVRHGFF